MKNLLIIIHHLDKGGAEKCAASLSKLMDGEFKVYIVTFFSSELFQVSYEYSGELHCIGQRLATSPLHKIRNTIQRISFLRKFKKKHNIDVSVSYLFSGDMVNIFSKRKDRTVLALSSFLSANATGRTKDLIKRFYHRADQVVALNERGSTDVIENFNIPAQKIKVIPNFYDSKAILQKYHAPVPEWLDTDVYFKFIQVGRFTYAKGQWHLLRIFRQLLDKQPKARLFIAGVGELKDYLVEYAAELNLSLQDLCDTDDKTPDLANYQVVLLGFTSNPFKYLRESDAFLFTSIYEGFPNALAEAMMCGMPVFSTDCTTGPRELIAPNQSTLDKYIDNTQLFGNIGENAQKRMEEFDKENVKRMWVELLNE